MCVAVGVPDRAGSSTPAADRDGGPADRRPGLHTGRSAPAGRAPAAAHPGQRPAARRELAAADRPGAAPPQPRVHRDLRQGRRRPASRRGPVLAGTGLTVMTNQIDPSVASHDVRGLPGGLRQAAQEYLATRRALGFVLSTQGRLLLDFVDHCERHAIATVTTDAAVSWAIDTTRSQDPLWWARRLMVVRIFARHLRALDP